MYKEAKHITGNRFSIVDVSVDVVLIATALVLPRKAPDFVSVAATGFLVNLAQVGLLFIGYFGLALYLSRMYYATAVKSDAGWNHNVLHPTMSLALFTLLFGLNILVSAYNIMQTIAPPVFTSLLIIAEALFFGFTFGLDYAIERHRASDPDYTIPIDNKFSQSLTFIPYLLLTFLLLYPMDYISLNYEIPLLGRIITLIGSCVAVFLLSGLLGRGPLGKLQMTAQMNFITVGIVSFLMIVGFMGLDVLEAFSKNPVTIADSSVGSHIAFLFFFGIVPIRIGTILFSRTVLFNRILGIVALSFYLSLESGLLHFDWFK